MNQEGGGQTNEFQIQYKVYTPVNLWNGLKKNKYLILSIF